MPRYHLRVATATDALNMTAMIKADSPEEALQRIKHMLPESWDTDDLQGW